MNPEVWYKREEFELHYRPFKGGLNPQASNTIEIMFFCCKLLFEDPEEETGRSFRLLDKQAKH